ncbi:MAG TPA: hypothetical protein VG269_09490 [Tepidisphaeraceae bacterium]|jgi:hypothetical protein|nr:hypothetical protein [Tepidisphaeraceae bacterium]
MKHYSPLVVLLGIFALNSAASATEFAILIQRSSDPPIVVKNPLYQGGSLSGVNPFSLGVDPAQVWQGATEDFTVRMDTDLPPNLPAAPDGAFVFEADLSDDTTGVAIHQLANPVTITFDMGTAVDPANYQFGSLDAATNTWKTGAPVTQTSNNTLCGTTDHFSVFYLAATPEPSTCAIALLGAGALASARPRRARVICTA